MQDDDCIFCKISKHVADAKVELENDKVIAFKSIAPVASVHIIIIPKEHIPTFTDLEDQHMQTFNEMAKAAQELIEKKNISDGYKLIFNGGKYQSVPHIHWHLIAGDFEKDWENRT